jgi:hypothetical protein
MTQAAERVPFAFVSDARPHERYASNVAPPRPGRVPLRTVCGRIAVGVLLVAGLVAAVLVGTPALSVPEAPDARSAPVGGGR